MRRTRPAAPGSLMPLAGPHRVGARRRSTGGHTWPISQGRPRGSDCFRRPWPRTSSRPSQALVVLACARRIRDPRQSRSALSAASGGRRWVAPALARTSAPIVGRLRACPGVAAAVAPHASGPWLARRLCLRARAQGSKGWPQGQALAATSRGAWRLGPAASTCKPPTALPALVLRRAARQPRTLGLAVAATRTHQGPRSRRRPWPWPMWRPSSAPQTVGP
mmetsp:Transcript_70166/g.227114  ORF Transcript_70166/g.227114 Transcript_70166/m.227114 type:complete len:221 (-) Transcript_70166:1002-1664(-)